MISVRKKIKLKSSLMVLNLLEHNKVKLVALVALIMLLLRKDKLSMILEASSIKLKIYGWIRMPVKFNKKWAVPIQKVVVPAPMMTLQAHQYQSPKQTKRIQTSDNNDYGKSNENNSNTCWTTASKRSNNFSITKCNTKKWFTNSVLQVSYTNLNKWIQNRMNN